MGTKKVDFDTAVSTVFQHLLVAGNFTGVELGRPTISYGAGNSQVIFRGKNLGDWLDSVFYVEVVAPPGPDNPTTIATYISDINTLKIILKKTAGVITATAKDVADAVTRAYSLDPKLNVFATYGGTGLGVVTALPRTTFSGTLNPETRLNTIINFQSAADPGGLFNFNNFQNLVVRHFEAKLGASVAWTLDVVQFDMGMRIIPAETTRLAGATSQDVFVPLNYVINPLRGLLFTAASTGVARVIAHREAPHPVNS